MSWWLDLLHPQLWMDWSYLDSTVQTHQTKFCSCYCLLTRQLGAFTLPWLWTVYNPGFCMPSKRHGCIYFSKRSWTSGTDSLNLSGVLFC